MGQVDITLGGKSPEASSLEAISQQATLLANLISSMSNTISKSRGDRSVRRLLSSDDIRMILKARQMRASFITDVKFAEPIWDMLLDLFASRLEGQSISASSLGLASGVPVSTAMRHIEHLCAIGVLEKDPDPCDRRRSYVRLSPACEKQMARYFTTMSRMDLIIA